MPDSRCRLFTLVVAGEDVKSFATIPFLERYVKKEGIKHYTIREEVRVTKEDDNG